MTIFCKEAQSGLRRETRRMRDCRLVVTIWKNAAYPRWWHLWRRSAKWHARKTTGNGKNCMCVEKACTKLQFLEGELFCGDLVCDLRSSHKRRVLPSAVTFYTNVFKHASMRLLRDHRDLHKRERGCRCVPLALSGALGCNKARIGVPPAPPTPLLVRIVTWRPTSWSFVALSASATFC